MRDHFHPNSRTFSDGGFGVMRLVFGIILKKMRGSFRLSGSKMTQGQGLKKLCGGTSVIDFSGRYYPNGETWHSFVSFSKPWQKESEAEIFYVQDCPQHLIQGFHHQV